MLRDVLRLVEGAKGPVSLAELSRQLDVAPAVLEGMLEHWARKGRLAVSGGTVATCHDSCAGRCGSCAGAVNCPFVARLPKSYLIVVE
jgi:hypothetical protein